ncbi:hypothetical protein [Arenimonas sp.]|uniref:hypothetical protein n=1 Tax=Arenimonas sp. TaxID=1872635 RepID=UPI0035ADF6C6
MSARRASTPIVIVLLLAAGLALLAWWRQDDDRPLPAAEDKPAAAPGARSPPPNAAASREQIAAAHSLPASSELARLMALAQAGNARANCQVAYELLRCQHQHQQSGRNRILLGLLAERERIHEAEGDIEAANRVAGQQALLIESARVCQEIPPELAALGGQFLRQSALRGDPVGMMAYAQGYQFNPSGRGMAVDPTFEAWRDEAPAMLHRALLAGLPSAAFSLSLAYHEDVGTPSSLVPDDPYRAAVYHILSTRLFRTGEQRAWLDKLDLDQLQRARQEAERLHGQLFKGESFGPREQQIQYPTHYQPNRSAPACELPQ